VEGEALPTSGIERASWMTRPAMYGLLVGNSVHDAFKSRIGTAPSTLTEPSALAHAWHGDVVFVGDVADNFSRYPRASPALDLAIFSTTNANGVLRGGTP